MNRQATAYHEAGHAVIGRKMGLVCGGATIVPNEDEGEAGHSIAADPWATVEAWWNAGRDRDYEHALLGRIVTYMAGAETECVVYGHCVGGDDDDRRQIAYMADALGWRDESRVERLRKYTRYLCERHRTAIDKVQAALLKRQTLSGDDIDYLLAASPITSR
jgi:ATP-dependent Zn protease